MRLISSWKGLLSIFWQIIRSKPKHLFVWYSRNQFGFAVKTFFFGLHLLFGTDSRNTDGNLWSILLAKMHVVHNNFSPVNVARTSKKVGQPWSSASGALYTLLNTEK